MLVGGFLGVVGVLEGGMCHFLRVGHVVYAVSAAFSGGLVH